MITRALQTLIQRESYWLQKKISGALEKRFVIFPAGPTAQTFYHTLKNEYGIEAKCFVDNSSALNGKSVCGKPVMTPEALNGGNDFVLIPTSRKFYSQISVQLESAGFTEYMHADAFCACQLWDRYAAAASLLIDDTSRNAYFGAIYSLMTGDNSFIQYESDTYFSIREFANTSLETIVDAGAFVGDTVEKYVERGSEGLKLYAFEPYEPAFLKLAARVERLKKEWILGDDDIQILPAGIGAKTEQISFSMGCQTMLKPNERGEIKLQVYSLDDFFKDKTPFTLLKADIEGGEMDLLRGAEALIRCNKPKMALCIYHSPRDFAQIVEYVHELVPEYKMSVRNHYPNYQDTVLYTS